MLFYHDNSCWDDIVNQTYDIEFDYLAFDCKNQIGVFSTFNRAYTPSCVTKSFEQFMLLDKFLESLTQYSGTVYAKQDNKETNYNDWQKYSELGFFAYDNQDVHRPFGKELMQFDIIYKPIKPIFSTQLLELNKFSEIIPKFSLTFGNDLKFCDLKNSLIE